MMNQINTLIRPTTCGLMPLRSSVPNVFMARSSPINMCQTLKERSYEATSAWLARGKFIFETFP